MSHYKGETGVSTSIERLTDKQKRDLRAYKEKNRYKPLAPAPAKKGGLFRKHGQGGKFQSENT